MTSKIRRPLVKSYLDTTPTTTATYRLLGDGVVSGKIKYNPKTTTETYIDEDTANTSVDHYEPNMPIEMTCKLTDPVFEFIDALRIARAVLSDAETNLVNVWDYQVGGPTAAPAEKQTVSIQIDDFGGDGGQVTKINFTINFCGDPIPGTFNTSTRVFTP
jgi:hypothetical protein